MTSSSGVERSSTGPERRPAPPTSPWTAAGSAGSGRSLGEAATRTVDADGLLVTPGWVDIHTHYDGQATWDEVLAPSSWHGVTTVVTGNCGVGFAPARPDRHEWLIGLMEGVEDIPGDGPGRGHDLGVGDLPRVPRRPRAGGSGPWTWDPDRPRGRALLRDGRPGGPQRGGHPRGHRGHEAVGQRGDRRRRARASRRRGPSPTWPSTASRCPEPTPPRTSSSASASALGELGTGVFELAPAGIGRRGHHHPEEGGGLDAPALGRHPPARHLRPGAGRRRPRAVARAHGRVAPGGGRGGRPLAPGGRARLRAAVRSLHHLLPLRPDPRLPGAEGQGPRRPTSSSTRCAAPRSAASIESWEPDPATAERMDQAFRTTFALGSPPEYEPGPERSLAGMAAATGPDAPVGGLRRHARGGRPGPALRAHPQLLGRRPRAGPRDAAPPPRGRRAWATAAPTAGSSATPPSPPS